MDKNLYVWSKKNGLDEFYSFQYALKSDSVSDYKILDYDSNEKTIGLLYCTNTASVKLQNISTKSIIFEFNLEISPESKLTSILNLNNYAVAADSAGFLYFLNMKSVSLDKKICLFDEADTYNDESASLECLAAFQGSYLGIGDSNGHLYILSLE